MINELQNIFYTLITDPQEVDLAVSDYQWFINDNNEIFGVQKEELTTKDTALLNALLTPYRVHMPPVTEKEKMWKKRIEMKQSEMEPIENRFRFVYFSIKKNQIDPQLFKEAIQELFAKKIAILWESEQEGVIIEELTVLEDSISYEQIIEVLMSDLYVKINFLIGPFQDDLTHIGNHYRLLITSAQTAFIYSTKSVITYAEAIPYLLMEQADTHLQTEISKTVLTTFVNDEEMLETIGKFVLCNLNVSETAKQLYMHRNSLQYRLDKFAEKTGIDIRLFHNALTVYLAIIANKGK